MSVRLAVVLVHYHTPRLAAEAYAALAADAALSGLEVDWLLVDNGSTADERQILAPLPLRRLAPGENLGYAGAANLGVGSSAAPLVVVMNPDVVVLPGCLASLCQALEGGAAAAGPRFFWDRARRFRLPPTEPRSRRWELLRLAAERRPAWARLARRRWRRDALRHWQAEAPLMSYQLSGALLALRRDAWQRVGPFDEGYRLYFEEVDWLERLRRQRLPALHVPAAKAIHLYAASTRREPRAAGWFAASHRRFRRRHYGAVFAMGVEWLAARRRTAVPQAHSGDATVPLLPGGAARWLELSPERLGFPAAGAPLQAGEHGLPLPGDLLERLEAGAYTLRWVDAAGRELAERRILPAAPQDPVAQVR